jgi:hypothetical protein
MKKQKLSPASETNELVWFALSTGQALNDWEWDFLISVQGFDLRSPKQVALIHKLYEKALRYRRQTDRPLLRLVGGTDVDGEDAA